ncbi:hypothetical protein GZL_07655 [Streptomyces sp. 769]|nr:hypothetical protein GZL_07655 [Streptomyces sp. 769]
MPTDPSTAHQGPTGRAAAPPAPGTYLPTVPVSRSGRSPRTPLTCCGAGYAPLTAAVDGRCFWVGESDWGVAPWEPHPSSGTDRRPSCPRLGVRAPYSARPGGAHVSTTSRRSPPTTSVPLSSSTSKGRYTNLPPTLARP